MKKNMVSVIVPVYKSEQNLPKLLDDLIMQSYKNLEVILVNDGSPDNCQMIIEKYAEKDSRIRFVQTDNKGVSSARNLGLQLATGKYIRFLDSDDRLPYNSIQLLVEVMEQDEEIDLVFGTYETNSNKQLYTGESRKYNKVSKEEMIHHFVMYVKTFYYGVVWNKLYKREIIEKNGICFLEGIVWCEDFLFNLEYYQRCCWFYYMDNKQSIYTYVEHSDSTMGMLHGNNDWEVKNVVSSIDELRRYKARSFFREYGFEKQFELQWKYTFLYNKIIELGKPNAGKNVKERYRELINIFKDDDVIEYIENKMKVNANEKMWYFVYKVIKRKKYLILFMYLSFRGIVATYLFWLKPIWNKVLKKNRPINY